MKKIFVLALLFTCVLTVFSCRKKGEVHPSVKLETELLKDTTKIEFLDSVTFFFDTINEGDKVEHDFRIKNAGDKNLLIAHASGDCGCTVPKYPKEPIKPGEVATIQVTFNSEGKTNEQKKTVTLVCNTVVRNEKLYIQGFVKPKK